MPDCRHEDDRQRASARQAQDPPAPGVTPGPPVAVRCSARPDGVFAERLKAVHAGRRPEAGNRNARLRLRAVRASTSGVSRRLVVAATTTRSGSSRAGGVHEAVDRRVRAEIGDAPAAAVQGEAERDQPESCCSPGAQARTARGPSPESQPRPIPSSRPRIRLLAKCSWATVASPVDHRSPRSTR